MFNYLVEDRVSKRDLPVPFSEYTENNRDLYLFTLVDGDTVITLSSVFNEQDARRLRLIDREVVTLEEQLNFYAYA